ncbi:MAG: hypothetical protein KatS3mg090_0175 [Patescibacteria group bacterium]|nr:MAG: hypothetical protein KatS3mg090_0175 [Patescibacteria group bacterium]
MNTDIQILLINLALSVTTILIIIIGIQLILVLRELRKVLSKSRDIIESLENAGISAKEGFTEITGFISGIKTIIKLVSKIKNN